MANFMIFRFKVFVFNCRAVNRALSNLVAPDQNVNDAVDIRQELDLRIGKA